MSQHRFAFQPHRRVMISIKLANELWFNLLNDGERHTHIMNVGIYSRPDTHPGIRLFSLTLLWLSIQIGVSA